MTALGSWLAPPLGIGDAPPAVACGAAPAAATQAPGSATHSAAVEEAVCIKATFKSTGSRFVGQMCDV